MHTIQLRLREASQLYNSMDPSPFHDKDLDKDAEEFIVSWAHEYALKEKIQLQIHLEKWPEQDPSAAIEESIHNYFSYRTKLNHLEFKRLLEQGRISLLIGLLFLAACLLISKLLPVTGPFAWASFLRESVTIIGWVAMWRPLEIYLYDWWPLYRRGAILQKLSKMQVKALAGK